MRLSVSKAGRICKFRKTHTHTHTHAVRPRPCNIAILKCVEGGRGGGGEGRRDALSKACILWLLYGVHVCLCVCAWMCVWVHVQLFFHVPIDRCTLFMAFILLCLLNDGLMKHAWPYWAACFKRLYFIVCMRRMSARGTNIFLDPAFKTERSVSLSVFPVLHFFFSTHLFLKLTIVSVQIDSLLQDRNLMKRSLKNDSWIHGSFHWCCLCYY